MNIKSLLLGSAAALVAVSGARAADAVEVVAEPEPMEYVRVCDTYGAGFYYIPGTETCLRVGGYIRYDIGVGQQGLADVVDKEDLSNGVIEHQRYLLQARSFRSAGRCPFGNRARHSAWLCTDQLQLHHQHHRSRTSMVMA